MHRIVRAVLATLAFAGAAGALPTAHAGGALTMSDSIKKIEKEEAQKRNAPAIARLRAAEARKNAAQEAAEQRRSGHANAKRVSEVAGKPSTSSAPRRSTSTPDRATSPFPEKPAPIEDNGSSLGG